MCWRFKLINSFFIIFSIHTLLAQAPTGTEVIIQKIFDLEKNKDPKCYATASRLEDFMYGTPLTEDARNFKIEIQKEITYYLRERAGKLAAEDKAELIRIEDLETILDEISLFTKLPNGDFEYQLTTGKVRIRQKDYQQYTSVAYGYRTLLSVEQDLMFFSENKLASFNPEALELANKYINLLTLVNLKVADLKAREANKREITKELLKETWILVLNESENTKTLASIEYPKEERNESNQEEAQMLVRRIINQKIAAYETYNSLSESVFLRNLQVYFARQKWPTDQKLSGELRNYYLESLIAFSESFLRITNEIAASNEAPIIRTIHVEKGLSRFLPSYTNSFEDVTFFPHSKDHITLESYDLDAFRDSGFHWRILGYSLDDLKEQGLRPLDPNAAEIMVEGIAQMGVLVLRLAGNHSHEEGKIKLDKQDITAGFQAVQQLIDNYDYKVNFNNSTGITSSVGSSSKGKGFSVANMEAGIDFSHKSSDWLNRLIRSYSVSTEEGLIKLSIPPAFGGSGVACEDINGDGLTDILLLGGFGNKLFLNSGNGSFNDITEQAGINSWNEDLNSFGEARQPIIADFNNDGFQDIFITYVNQPHRMYANENGLRFVDQTEFAGLGGENAVAGPATAFDYDNDGWLDIFIGYFGNYIEGSLPTLKRDNRNGLPNKLYRNLGNFEFEEVTFTSDASSNSGWTQALGHADINQDGWQDIIVGNDFGVNKYYLNQKDGTFKEMSAELGTDKPSYTMNVGITDLNRDLFPDFYISNIVVMQKDEKYVSPNEDTTMKFDPEKMANIRTVEANDLFLSKANNGQLESFQLSTDIGRGYSATGWSWDADFFDFDNDGDEDLYCLNGMNDFSVYSSENPFYFERQELSKNIIYAESNREKNVFFVNEGNGLVNRAEELNADLNSNARSAAYLDYDLDGDLDIIINNYHEEAVLLKNNTSGNNNWIKIRLIGDYGSKVNKDAIGSSMVLNSENNKNIWREVHSTTGYLSVHPKEQHFGLGTDETVSLEINWSNGETYNIPSLSANKRYEIVYPDKVRQID